MALPLKQHAHLRAQSAPIVRLDFHVVETNSARVLVFCHGQIGLFAEKDIFVFVFRLGVQRLRREMDA